MKNLFLTVFLCFVVVGCLGDDTQISDESADVVSGPDAGSETTSNVGGGGECGTDPVEQERNCPGSGGGSSTCERIGQACSPPPHMPHDSVCAYEQGPNGCVCRCFRPGEPALTEYDPELVSESELDAYWLDEDRIYSIRGKGETAQKDRYDAIAACMVNCVEKYDAGCPAMDTYGERQICFDACQYNQTYPNACEAQYIALQNCRSFPLNSYDCNSAGEPVSTVSCLTESLALGYCKFLNQ